MRPAGRSDDGYRLYDAESVARLELVATLRELGLGLAEVRRVLERETTVAEVAAAQVLALDTQIRALRLRRGVLATVAESGLRAHLRQAPESAEGAEVLRRILGDAPGEQRLPETLRHLETFTDARAERYWQLVGVINGWPPFPARVPAFEWVIAALRAHS